jgi:hypothetical protein
MVESTGAIAMQPLRTRDARDGECATRVRREPAGHLLTPVARQNGTTTHEARGRRHDDVKSSACGARRFTHFARLLPISFLSELLIGRRVGCEECEADEIDARRRNASNFSLIDAVRAPCDGTDRGCWRW